ncbi:MAG TPA: NAD(+) synthase [Verrucomicrobiae bacterium]|nr:NAD(+) synthase [Verrucomicrobiae bacterium]
MNETPLSAELLRLDCVREAERIEGLIRETVLRRFKKKGVVVGLSGGVDSSTVAALAVRALGRERVLGLMMPEQDSSPETLRLSQQVAAHLGMETVQKDISGILEAVGCYRRQAEAIQAVIAEYGPGWKSKLVLPSVIKGDQLRIFSIVAESPSGERREKRLPLETYLSLVAATNFKQRARKMLEYYHADRLNYAVTGTPNLLEYDQGFFVKLGDGAADIKPIAHLYKTQVYQMGEFLGVPQEILSRPPTTDTYSMPQSQEEFYFSLPYNKMDLVLYGKDRGYNAAEIGGAVGLTAEQVGRVFRDIEGKRRMARYLHAQAAILGDF